MKGLRLYLIIGGAVFILYLIAQLSQPKQIDWSESLSSADKIPFGTYIVHDRLNDIFPQAKIKDDHEPVYNVITDDSIENSSYIIICQQLKLTKYDYRKLTQYLSRGNDVLISAESFDGAIEDNLDVRTELAMGFVNRVTKPVSLVSPHLNPTQQYRVDKGCTNTYFTAFDTARAVVVGKDTDNKANFIRFKFGKGNLYLTSNPRMFSNYSMLTADGAKYAATVLSYVKNTPTVVWDDYYTQGSSEASLMRVFFGNRHLQWAYYVTIFSLLLFVLYEMKRRQRIIPVIAPLRNSTVEFVNVIGQLYYEKRNNADIAHKQVVYILAHLRETYHIKTDKFDEDFVERLIGKVGLDEEFARQFAKYLQFIAMLEHVNDDELIGLNKLIEQFYKKSR
jgi:hypothetical protein